MFFPLIFAVFYPFIVTLSLLRYCDSAFENLIRAVVHQILSKSNNIFTEIWWFKDFQNDSRPPSWILKICSFCSVTFVGMPFCFFTQNFAEIGKSVDDGNRHLENRSCGHSHKSDFQDGGCRHLEFQKFQFLLTWQRSGSPFTVSVLNFIKNRQFFTDIWRFDDFQDGGRPPSWI